jgi:hypothetical protein
VPATASGWHGRGQGFESPKLHRLFSLVSLHFAISIGV